MEKEEISIEAPIVVAGVTLVLVAKTSLNCWHSQRGLSAFGIKQPVSVVVVSPQSRRAFRIDGEEIPLEQLNREVPGMEEMLEGI